MKPQTRSWLKIAMLSALCLLSAIAWLGYLTYRSLPAVEFGAESVSEKDSQWLAGQLKEEFGWSNLPENAILHSWANGFQDYNMLDVIKLSPSAFEDLKAVVCNLP